MGENGEMVIKSQFEFEHVPKMFCSQDTSTTAVSLLIVAFSTSKNERNNVRQTWAQKLPENVKVLFMLGQQQDMMSQEEKMSSESEKFQDILQSKVAINDPAYEFKQLLILLSWVYHECPTLRFVLKTTSDTYINVPKVSQLVEQEMYAANRIYGELVSCM